MENRRRKRRRKLVIHPRFYAILVMGLLVVAALTGLIILLVSVYKAPARQAEETGFNDLVATVEPMPDATMAPTPRPAPTARHTESSNPQNYGYIQYFEVDGTEQEDFNPLQRTRLASGSYTLAQVWHDALNYTRIGFPLGEDYTKAKGVTTFRGNNARTAPAWGNATVNEKKLTEVWTNNVGALKRNNSEKTWSGCGWTGQPLIIEWDDQTRQCMNLYDWAKATDGLVEVIYPTMDGSVHFYELGSGRETRDALVIGMPFKGTGSIDPRGYPILYLGSGDQYDNEAQKCRVMAYSLIDFTRMYEFGIQGTDSFAKRVFYAWDSAPLIDEKTDTLIYPGENGVIYTMRLNTLYDSQNGRVSISPTNMVKIRYDSDRSSTGIEEGVDMYWLGYEGSASAWNGLLFLSSNDGLFQCIDLSTMKIKWIADTLDDTNGSPVLDVISDTEAYLYVGTSLHFTKDGNSSGVTPLFKINALTGEIVGRYAKTCYTQAGVSGGIQDTAALGKNDMEGLVLINFARYPDTNQGVLVALDKNTMEERWQFKLEYYSWSSPLIIYTPEGKGYVIQADSGGNMHLLEGVSGNLITSLHLDRSNFEASPAAYNNMIVVGCRGQKVFGVRIS